MSLITIDFETYYTDKDLGFKKQTTEEYINDPRFEVIGVGVKVDEEETEWFSGSHEDIKAYLKKQDWDNSAVICHNTIFDGAILRWRFGITPAHYFDTLCMARALHGVEVGGSLKSLTERYKIGEKGTEVVNAINKKRGDFTPEDLARYGEYCKNDVELTYKLFNILSSDFPDDELSLIDITLRMYIVPTLYVDDDLLTAKLEEIKASKLTLLRSLMTQLQCKTEEEVREKLASNNKFADVLLSFKVDPPIKQSPRTGKNTYALAKNDEGFIDLMNHPDEFIQQLCAVRLGTKSTLEESRIERFIDIRARNKGRIPIPLKYYGAHTGRWSGMDKVNFQNLPSRDKNKKTLKNAIVAEDEYTIINCDSSQIEARVLAWLAGQDDVVKQFAKGEDVYSIFASKIYKRDISKKDPVERFVGKTCILGLGYGTGWAKLQHTLKTSPPGAILDEARCEDIVDLYRSDNDMITALWREGDRMLSHLASWPKDKPNYYYGKNRVVVVTPQGLRLPNSLYIRYPNLRMENGKYVYDSRKGTVSIWGGTVVENVVQALARIIVGKQIIDIHAAKIPVVLTVHDAAVCVVEDSRLQWSVETVSKLMSTPPSWGTGLPIACEVKYANSYGEC